MKTVSPYINYIFNVKDIAYNKDFNDFVEGEFGIFPVNSNTSIASGADFDALPDEFRFMSLVGGKRYIGNTIIKSGIGNQTLSAYDAGQVNRWETIVKHCDCIETLKLTVNLDEATLENRDGLTWSHSDMVYTVPPNELECLCDCTGKGTYENHIMTKLLWDRVNKSNSQYYKAIVKTESGTVLADEAAIDAFIATNKTVNTDDNDSNDSDYLVLVLEGKPQPYPNYRDIDVSFTKPLGAKLNPIIEINDKINVTFTETQPLTYEINAGAIVRKLEYDNLSLSTNLNHTPLTASGVESKELIYQTENSVNYDMFTFTSNTDKTYRAGSGDKKQSNYTIVTDTTTNTMDDIVDMLLN